MKSKKLKSLIFLFLVVIVFLVGANYLFGDSQGSETSKPETESIGVANQTNESATFESSSSKEEAAENLQVREDIFGSRTVPREEAFMDALHKMTHQKVHATPKWGTLEITEERLLEMQSVLNTTQYDHAVFYQNALEQWLRGDFTNSVDVHNYIWNLQGGTVGEAKRLLTPEEEANYIDQYFR